MKVSLGSNKRILGLPQLRLNKTRSEYLQGYLLLLPSFLFLTLVIGYPLLRSLQLSFNRFKLTEGIDSERFCGLCNYIDILKDPFLMTYLKNQIIWVVGATVLPVLFGLAIALLLNRPLRLRWFWRSVVLVPWIMPIATSSLTWRWIYDRQWGILNYVLNSLGIIQSNVGFLTDRAWLWPSIFLVAIWMWFPYNYVSLMAALQAVPQELYEAGKIDGTNAWSSFWYITLPGILPILNLLLILGLIWSMNDFTLIYLLTEGGPGIDSTTMAPLVYKTSFRFFNLGKGAAIGVVLMAFSMVFATLYLTRSREEQ